MKYTKKPITIDAIRWNGYNGEEIKEFCGENAEFNGLNLVIKTLEGPLNAQVGDFIIKGIKGEFYPCKPDIFEALYDLG